MGGLIDDLTEAPESQAPGAKDEALFLKLSGWVKEGERGWGKWRKEARECFGLVAGDGFSDDDKLKMIDDGRQPVQFNRVGPIIDAICGLEVNGRQEIKFRPRTTGDAAVNDRLSALAKWARDEAQAEDEESDAFRDAVICGIGCTDTRMDYDTTPEGMPAVDRVDPLEVGFDKAASKPNAIDRRYAWRIRTLPLDAAKALFAGVDPVAMNASWAKTITPEDGGEGNKVDYPTETRAALMQAQANPKEITLVEIEWFDTEERVMVAAAGAPKPEIVTADDAATLIERLAGMGVQATQAKVRQRVYRRAVLGFNSVLEQQERDGFRLHFITGKRDRNAGCWYAMGRPMRDPQLLANKVLTQVLAILNTSAKGGLMVEEDAVKDYRTLVKDWANPSKVIKLLPGGLSKMQERQAGQMPVALVQLLTTAIAAIPDVTGVSAEMMGLADRDQPASLEYQRRQSAVTILAPLFDSLRRYRKEQARSLLALLRKMTPGVLVRVIEDRQTGPNGEEMAPQEAYMGFQPAHFGLDADSLLFDVIVDQAPSAPSQKEATWGTLTQLLSSGIQVPPQVMAELIKYSPLPATVADEVSKAMKGTMPLPPEAQQAMSQAQDAVQALQGQLQAAGQQIGAMQGELQRRAHDDAMGAADLDRNKLGIDLMRAQTDRMKAMADAAAKGLTILPDGTMLAPPSEPAEVPEQEDDGSDEAERAERVAVLDALAGMTVAVGQIGDTVAGLVRQLNAPKRLVRDAAGQIVGSETVSEVSETDG